MLLSRCRPSLIRSLASQSSSAATAAPSLTPPSPPLTPSIRTALTQLCDLPDTKEALTTSDLSISNTLFHRILLLATGQPSSPDVDLRPSMGAAYEAVAHSLLASHYHSLAHVASERHHRLQSISAMLKDSLPSVENRGLSQLTDAQRPMLCAAHLALSLCILRAPGPESLLASSSAVSTAKTLAISEQHHLTCALLQALSHSTSSPSHAIMLSALTTVDNRPPSSAIDIPGFARYFLSNLPPSPSLDPLDHAEALLVRWDVRPGFDHVEALVSAAKVTVKLRGSDGFAQAHDYLTRALKEVDNIGNELDKAEPLLALAELYAEKGSVVEAEGLFRSVEKRFEPAVKRSAFTVASAAVYCRSMSAFAAFLERVEFNGKTREREALDKREKMSKVKDVFPEVLAGTEKNVPLWFVESLMPHFDMPIPTVTNAKS